MKKITVSIFLYLMWISSSHAFSIWVVESGLDPLSNSQNTFQMTAGTTSFDLYYDVEGDTSYGYDMLLDVLGTGTIFNVGGGDSTLGNAVGSDWRQFGGDFLGETGSSVLGFSFDFTGSAGTSLLVEGAYTDASFIDTPLTASTLIAVPTMPTVPAPSVLFLLSSALVGLSIRRKKSVF